MVGNDIVDLNEARRGSHWKTPRFIRKIFTVQEQAVIAGARDPFVALWHLWSMKESAYKVFIQAGGQRFFNPAQIVCAMDTFPGSPPQYGKVTINSTALNTSTLIHADYIVSTAHTPKVDVDTRVFLLPGRRWKQQSSFMHQQIIRDFSQSRKLDSTSLHIQKTEAGVPRLHYKGRLLNTSISITHHGQYGAYAIERD